MESLGRSKNVRKKETEGMGWGQWGNKRTKLNTERREWKVFLQKERHRAGYSEKESSKNILVMCCIKVSFIVFLYYIYC